MSELELTNLQGFYLDQSGNKWHLREGLAPESRPEIRMLVTPEHVRNGEYIGPDLTYFPGIIEFEADLGHISMKQPLKASGLKFNQGVHLMVRFSPIPIAFRMTDAGHIVSLSPK